MLWSVICMRRAGVRLRRSQWEPPVVGTLQLSCMPTTSAGRPLRLAQLVEAYGPAQRTILAPLFEPQLIAIDGHATVLQGIEFAGAGDGVAEHVQVWHCTPVPHGSTDQNRPAGSADRPHE